VQPIKLDTKHVHFIGIGGISMSGLAEMLKKEGYIVSGSDDYVSDATSRLKSLGIKIYIGNNADNITGTVGLVVYTAAVKPDNPEYRAALKKGIPVMERAVLLFDVIMEGYDRSVCIAGTHGKTTTTSMIADTCLTAGLEPTVFIGGYMGGGYNMRAGDSPYFVAEACEYSNSFLQGRPYIGVILNIDNDHMDFFGSMDNLAASFKEYAHHIKPEGALVVHSGVPDLNKITDGLICRIITFGENDADFSARHVQYNSDGKPSFDVIHKGETLGRVTLALPGAHNITNALACAAAAFALGIKPEMILKGLQATKGVRRRFEYKGMYNHAEVVDDYAHHPTEIEACLSAARKSHAGKGRTGRIICLFQPHTYSRTRNLLKELAASFTDADLVVLLPIYASREVFDPNISSALLAEKINGQNTPAVYINGFDEAFDYLSREVMPGDLLITMGAGDVYLVGERLLRT
jgi:UDP-N-acetylmuramate--alanine ligase